jgi:hypothetical protein
VHYNPSIKTFKTIREQFDLIKKFTLLDGNITSSIDSAIKKDFMKFISPFINVDDINTQSSNNHYLLKDCLFVIKDLHIIIKNLESLGYNVKEIKNRSQLNILDAFLHSVNNEYMDVLYNLHCDLIKKHHIFHTS